MFELIVIYFVGRQNGRIATAKGRSGLAWFIATAAVWIGLQTSVALLAVSLLALLYGLDSEFSEVTEFVVIYVPSLLAAGAGVLALNRKLVSLPPASSCVAS